MVMINSGTSFFRQELKIKGKSIHSGRGYYDMEFDCSFDALHAKIEEMIEKHKDILEVDRSGPGLIVTIKKEATYHCYRRLVADHGDLVVQMVFDKEE